MDHPKVSDLSQLQATEAAPASRAGKLARVLGEIVSAGSLLQGGELQLSALACRRRPNRRPCPGKLRIHRHPETDDLHWTCPTCGDAGVITRWQRTRWDLGPELKGGRVVSLSVERARRAGRGLPATRLQLIELEVELVHAPVLLEHRVLRQIRLSGEHTLQDLHTCIHAAFDRAGEQPYEFMFGAPYDPETRRFSGPAGADDGGEGFWDTRLIRVDSLGLRPGRTFGYLYDFDAEWVHRVTVLGAREVTGHGVPPVVIERLGSSPITPASEEWAESETAPLSGLYGPYQAEEGPEADEWLALDELERQLLVVEAHARNLPASHPPLGSPLVHGLVHSLAETHLAERGETGREVWLGRSRGLPRHQLVHELGARLLRELLDGVGALGLAPAKRTRRQGPRPRPGTTAE